MLCRLNEDGAGEDAHGEMTGDVYVEHGLRHRVVVSLCLRFLAYTLSSNDGEPPLYTIVIPLVMEVNASIVASM